MTIDLEAIKARVAAAREDVTALVAEVERLRRELDSLRTLAGIAVPRQAWEAAQDEIDRLRASLSLVRGKMGRGFTGAVPFHLMPLADIIDEALAAVPAGEANDSA